MSGGAKRRVWTRGRERELHAIGATAEALSAPDSQANLIHSVHDWLDGSISTEKLKESFFALLDQKPTKIVLEAAFYWLRRLQEANPGFEDVFAAYCESRHALVRLYAANTLPSISNDEAKRQFRAFLNDRSKRVRGEIIQAAQMRRWRVAVTCLQDYLSSGSCGGDSDKVACAIELIEKGFRLDTQSPERVWWYSGDGPGGSGAVSSSLIADVPVSLLTHINEIEERYWKKNQAYPMRPEGYAYDLNLLRNWKPPDRA